MLTPEQLKELSETAGGIFEELEEDIIKDIARRIAKAGKITPTADWQIKLLSANAVGKKEIKRKIAKALKIGLKDVERLFNDAMGLSYIQDKSIYSQAGISISEPVAMTAFIAVAKRQTLNEFKNITRTLAFAGIGVDRFYDKVTLETANAYIASLDKGVVETVSGAFTYREAIKRAVKTMTDKGLQSVEYATGHTNHVDSAISRAVMTGVSQTAAKTTEMFMDEYDADFVEVSAHIGARVGDGIANHAEWQGKVYSYKKEVKGYQTLAEGTGYGEGDGLGGWNCRHSFSAFWLGISERRYTDEYLEKLKNTAVEYNGQAIPYYEATQKQRYREREIRSIKRELLAFDEIKKENPSMVDEDYYKLLSVKLKSRQNAYKDFSHQTELNLQNDRTQTLGFGRSEAARVVATNKRLDKDLSVLLGIETNNGIKISEVRVHFKEQLLSRKVSIVDAENALKNPIHVGKIKYDEKGASQVFIGNNATIVINPDTGGLVSTYLTGRDRRKKYGKNQTPF